jgi:hypothetical protein
MIVIFLLIILIIVMYVFLNYKQKKDNFLSNELLSDNSDYSDNWEFKNIEIEKFLLNKPKYKDVDELMNETKEGETIYDLTSVKLKNK